jgi:hypothetical protein
VGDRASTAMAMLTSASPGNKQGHVRSGCGGDVPCMQKGAERERDGSTATFTLAVDLPKALRALAMVLLRL